MQVQTFETIDGVSVVSPDGSFRRPFIGIVGGLHGNERCGLEVLRALGDADNPVCRRLKEGTLVLIHGNPEATRQDRRFTEGGADLNRLFDFQFLETLSSDVWSYEHHRAVALRPLLEELDAALDLHSSTLPSDPFVITRRDLLSAAGRLGCRWVTHGWDGPGLLEDKVLTGLFHRRQCPAYSVECGQHEAPETFAFAWQVAERFLEILGTLEGQPEREGMPCEILQVVHRVGKPTLNFSFARPFSGFDAVAPGELLGRGDGVELSVQDSFRVLLPNPNVPVGEDMLYLGRVSGRVGTPSRFRGDY